MEKKENKNDYNPEITKDDKQALGDVLGHLRNDDGDDTLLKRRETDVDFTAKDLDVPGRVLPKDKTKRNFKDEENQHYSFGSADNESLESNK